MKPLFSTLLFFLGYISFSQNYKDLMNDPTVNIYDVINAAEKYFKAHPEKVVEPKAGDDRNAIYEIESSDWALYQKWRYFAEQHYYPSGDRFIQDSPRLSSKRIGQLITSKSFGLSSNNSSSKGNWQLLGTFAPSYLQNDNNPSVGRTDQIWVDPNDDNYIYAASRSGGFWKTIDGGITWTSSTQDLEFIACNSFGVSHQDRDVVYMGSSGGISYFSPLGLGVLKSTDGGETWETTSLTNVLSEKVVINSIEVHPTNHDIVYVASNKGLFKSEDGLLTSTKIHDASSGDVKIVPTAPDVLYFASRGDLFKSSDAGATIAPLSAEASYVAVAPTNPDYVYAVYGTDLNKSTDGGTTFTTFQMPGRCLGGLAVAEDPEVFYMGAASLLLSEDGGANFVRLGNRFLHKPYYKFAGWDFRGLYYKNGTIYTANDAILSKSSDNITWQSLVQGDLPIREIYGMGSSPFNPYEFLIGTQDHGVYYYKDGEWIYLYSGDGAHCFYHATDPNIFFVSQQSGLINRKLRNPTPNNPNQATNTVIKPEAVTGKGEWVTPFLKDPTDPNLIYVGYKELYRSNDNGDTWKTVGDFPSFSSRFQGLTQIAVSASDNNYIFASTRGFLWRTKNAQSETPTWERITGLPNLYVAAIAIDPRDKNIVYVSLSGYGAGQKVFKSIDAGGSWTNISGSLPNIPTTSLVIDTTDTHGLYLGLEAGVYYKDDTLTDWIPFNGNLPNLSARTLELIPSINKIRIGSWGRGVWQSDIYKADELPPVAQFAPDKVKVPLGGDVTFTDLSSGSPSSWSWSFPGGSPSVSNEQNPLVRYRDAGTYDVTLMVTNPNGSHTTAKSQLLVVKDVYCNVAIGPDRFSYFANIKLADLDNNSTNERPVNTGRAYSDYTSEDAATLKQGETYDFTADMWWARGGDRIYAWVDFNQDYNFDFDELVINNGDPSDGFRGKLTTQISIPESAPVGVTRMRVFAFSRAGDRESPPYPCIVNSSTKGEIEDYSIIIEGKELSIQSDNVNTITLYPNPVTDRVFYIQSQPFSQKFKLELFDSYGKKHFESEYTMESSRRIQVPVPKNLKAGLYFAKISNNKNQSRTQKLIIIGKASLIEK